MSVRSLLEPVTLPVIDGWRASELGTARDSELRRVRSPGVPELPHCPVKTIVHEGAISFRIVGLRIVSSDLGRIIENCKRSQASLRNQSSTGSVNRQRIL